VKVTVAISLFLPLSLAFGGTALAATVSYSGTLIDGAGYHRPSYTNPNTPAINCTNCGFQSEAVSVSLTGNYTFQTVSSNFDDLVSVLYSTSFDPATPMTNFVGPLAYATYLSGGATTVALASGVQYQWVTSTDFGYQANNCGAGCTFTTSITGPGTITSAVPEPATWAMMIGGFGMVGGAMRSARRKQKLTLSYA
jgi:hypothetical protein